MVFDGADRADRRKRRLRRLSGDATTEEDLIRKADIALYRAKQEGRGSIRTFDSSMDADIEARAKLEEELREAIESGAVVPYFQPLVDLRRRRASAASRC